MSKPKSPHRKSRREAPPLAAVANGPRPNLDKETSLVGLLRQRVPSAAALREGVQMVVETFILVFLIITFEVQAFVIPTGSLAPTLLGRHKDIVCPHCGYPYRVSASGEVDSNTGVSQGPGQRVEAATCPMCRGTANLGPGNPSFGGERILVSRCAYHVVDPQRWDIAPFKFPGGATSNYIKRIAGLPSGRRN